jgi:alkanesulfonate monooxygenase SsuD/methylene tetrahydromethanopterin reductase-like flavin-dependent oxidoreductase (luciferase family)
VPILVGGHVEGAARRAARFGDGFFPARGHDLAELESLIDAVRDECRKIGRDPAEVEITAGTAVQDIDAVRRYEDLGLSRIVMPPPAFDPEGLRKGLREFGDKIIAKL